MLDPDDGQWLTYREAGLILGISPEATRSLARRKGWARQTPNEIGGVARVLLPTGADRRSRPGETDGVTGVARRATVERPTVVSVDGAPGDRAGDRAGVLAVEIAIVALREQLAAAGAWRRPCLAGSIARLRGRDRTRQRLARRERSAARRRRLRRRFWPGNSRDTGSRNPRPSPSAAR